MAFMPAPAASKPRTLVPAGTHEAYCFGVVDLGTQKQRPFKGEPKADQREICIYWEFPEHMQVFDEKIGEEPMKKFFIAPFFTDPKSNLAKLCASWLGGIEGVDFGKLPGTPASITIAHEPSKSDPTKIYDNMKSVAPVSPKLLAVMSPRITPDMTFSIGEDGFDSPKFAALYPWLKKKIMESPEYQEYANGLPADAPTHGVKEEDIPPFS